MYKIKNITNGKLFINDLNIKLSSGETVDLDLKLSRDQIQNSSHLRVAESNELIAILHKDVIHQSPIFDSSVLAEMENRIRQQVIQEISTLKPSPTPDISGLSSKIDDLINIVRHPSDTAKNATEDTQNADTSDRLVEVHAKALKRITGGSSGHVEAKESVINSDVSQRADELDDFLE